MNYNHLKQLYVRSPAWVKRAYGLVPWSIRMGRVYRQTHRLLVASSKWNAGQWETYQSDQLRGRMRYCLANVPYYQRLFRSEGIDPEATDIFTEHRKIPFISKSEVRENFDSLLSNEFDRRQLYEASTGGTTGKPLRMLYDSAAYKKEWAYKMFFWKLAIGYLPHHRKATFRGVAYGDRLWIENPIYNEIRFSPFKIDQENAPALLDKLECYAPVFVHGYPSALELLCRFYRKLDRAVPPSIKGVILISENFHAHQRRFIEDVLAAPTYSFYGHAERLVTATMCEFKDTTRYHVHPGYGFMELVDDQGKVLYEPGERGEIVGSGLINSGMVLLRYKTGDYTSWLGEPCECGRSWPLISKIEGRWQQEHLVGAESQRVSLTALNMHSDIYENLQQMQFYQNQKGVVQLNIVRDDTFSDSDERKILEGFSEKLGDGFRVQIKYVDRLERTPAGKAAYFIQDIVS